MKRAVCLATIITPFHLKVLKRLIKDELLGKPVHLILPASFQLSQADEESFTVHRTLNNDFRMSSFWRNPLVVSRQSRSDFKDLRKNVSAIFDLYADCEDLDVLIFNEKSALAQVAIHEKLRRRSGGSVIAADEGLAYYIEDGPSVRFKQLVYPVLTWLLLGFRYQHFTRAGVHKAIDTVFMRYPDLINKKQKKYVEFRVSDEKQSFDPLSNRALLLTTPFSEFGALSEDKEAKSVKAVIQCLLEFGHEVVIKPHPFERPGKFSELESAQVTFASGKTIIEETNLEPFYYIVNFGSSAVIDVLDRGFPSENIITYMLTVIDSPFFENLKIARTAEELTAILDADTRQRKRQAPEQSP